MKVFICWSGDLSHKIAEAIKAGLDLTFPHFEILFSPEITRGTFWREKLKENLTEATAGILILTPDNLKNVWLHFEAGILAKQAGETLVCPLLFKLKTSQIKEPLSLFMATDFKKDDFLKMLTGINENAGSDKIENEKLKNLVDNNWPGIEQNVEAIHKQNHPKTKAEEPDRDAMLEELIKTTRETNSTVQSLAHARRLLDEDPQVLTPSFLHKLLVHYTDTLDIIEQKEDPLLVAGCIGLMRPALLSIARRMQRRDGDTRWDHYINVLSRRTISSLAGDFFEAENPYTDTELAGMSADAEMSRKIEEEQHLESMRQEAEDIQAQEPSQ